MSPPFSEDAEKGLLASAIIDADAAIGLSAKLLPEMLYIPAHQALFEAIRALVAKGVKVDFISLADELGTDGRLDDCGGKEWISNLMGFIPSGKNWEHYLRIVIEKYNLREIIAHSQAAISSAEAGDLLAATQSLDFRIASIESDEDLSSGKDLMLDINDYLEGIQDGTIEDKPMRWGIPAVETICDGARDGEFVLIGGESSHGKTALFCSIIGLGVICGKTNNPYLQPGNAQAPSSAPSFEYHLQDTDKKPNRWEVD